MLLASFAIRAALEAAQKLTGALEDQAPQKTFHRYYFDIGAMPLPDPNHKAYPGTRDPSKLDMITVHVTGVKGGFGVSGQQRQAWAKRMDDDGRLWLPLHMMPIGHQLDAAGVLQQVPGKLFREKDGYAFVMLDDPQRIASRLALWQRFRGVPYHQIATRGGDALANRLLSQRTKHGNGGNVGAGFACDMHPSEGALLDPAGDFAETCRHSLTMLAERMRVHNKGKTIRVVTHRQHSYPGRAEDPGAWVIQHVVLPVVAKQTNLAWMPTLTTGSGKPVPASWMGDQ